MILVVDERSRYGTAYDPQSGQKCLFAVFPEAALAVNVDTVVLASSFT